MAKTKAPTITIDGKAYKAEDLSEEVMAQLGNVRACDAELQRLNNQRAMIQTARNSYARQLGELLPKEK